jgi:hypothetical protein
MSFNIPGYFLDQKTKKLFKIQPHGPFSLKELQKRLQKEEEEEIAALAAASTSASNSNTLKSSLLRPPTNITQFLRQRSFNNSGSSTNGSTAFLMTQLKTRTTVQLEGPKHMYNDLLVDLTTDPNDYGEMIVSHRSGRLARSGYQVNPGFNIWNAHDWETESSPILSLQFGTRNFMLNNQERRTIVGTSGGSLWRYSVPKLPPLLNDEASLVTNNSGVIGQLPTTSYLGYTDSSLDCLFTRKKDLFWSSSFDDQNDHLVVGGDQAIYQLTSKFDFISSKKLNSSVFATHLPKDQPNICYTGSRNGSIQLIDFRQKNLYLSYKFRQSSSVTQIQSLNGYELLTVGMDGSVDIWDRRQPTRQSTAHKQQQHSGDYSSRGNYQGNRGNRNGGRGGYYKHQPQTQPNNTTIEPIRKLKGHINESSHHLGFDIDLENNLLMLSGGDGRVRIWSIFNSSSNEPIWCSDQYSNPIPAARFMVSQYPRLQDAFLGQVCTGARHQGPGVLLFGASKEDQEKSSIQWLTAIK